ncbi:uncharacterized protein LOC121376928 [Gigantopelta aegis]|uniref:uncharacterized protein LOC121376928 n=1 Tax=Gigantopelta aegis TaxID=1735272 RepID=UPI001B88D6D2|nr:uncharacterized protein LOC121376928 [Gigantopelta aegis]
MSEWRGSLSAGDFSSPRRRPPRTPQDGEGSSNTTTTTTASQSEHNNNRHLILCDLVTKLPESTATMLSRTPAILCGDHEMASWRDLKEIFFPRCSGRDCTIVENALKLKLQYPRNSADIRVCSSKEQMEFLKDLLHLVAPGSLLVNLVTFSRHLPALAVMVATKHHVSQDVRSLECMYAHSDAVRQTNSRHYPPAPAQKPFTVTLIHFPVLKLPNVSLSPEEGGTEMTFSRNCMSGEPSVESLETNCVPMRALLMARPGGRHRTARLPQHFVPLRYILGMYPGLLLELMKICADFLCQFPTQVALRRCTVEEAQELSSDQTSEMYLTSSDLLVQWTDPFYLLSCLQNRNLRPIQEERTGEDAVSKDRSNTRLTSSESFYESRGDSHSDCSDSHYDADIEETVDQSNSDERLSVVYNPFKMNITKKQFQWGSEKTTNSNRNVGHKDSKTSLSDQDEDADFDPELLFAATNGNTMGEQEVGKWELDLTKEDYLSNDGFELEILNSFPPAEKRVYDPAMIAIQLMLEEEKLSRQNRQGLVEKNARRVTEGDDDAETVSVHGMPHGEDAVDADVGFREGQNKTNSGDVSPAEASTAVTDRHINGSSQITKADIHHTRSSSSMAENQVGFDQMEKKLSLEKRLPLKKKSSFMEETSERNAFNVTKDKPKASHTFEIQALVHRNPSLGDMFTKEGTELSPGRETDDPNRRCQLSTARSSRSENIQFSPHEDTSVEGLPGFTHKTLSSPFTESVATSRNHSPFDGRLSASENSSPAHSVSLHDNGQPSPSCSRSTPDVAKLTPVNRSARRGVRKSRGSWYMDSDVPRLYKVLTASEVARRSAELVAVELSRRSSGLETDSDTNLFSCTQKTRRRKSSTMQSTGSPSPDLLPGLGKSSASPRNAGRRRSLFMGTMSMCEDFWDDRMSTRNMMKKPGRKSWPSRSVSKTPPFDKDVPLSELKQRTKQTGKRKSLPSFMSASEPLQLELTAPFYDDDTCPFNTPDQTGRKSISSVRTSSRLSPSKQTVYFPKIESNQQQISSKTGRKSVRSSSRLPESSRTKPSIDSNSRLYQTSKRTGRKSVTATATSTVCHFQRTTQLSGVETSPPETPKETGGKPVQTINTSKLSECRGITPFPVIELSPLRETGGIRTTSELSASKRSLQFSRAEMNLPHTSSQSSRSTVVHSPQSRAPQSPTQAGKKSTSFESQSMPYSNHRRRPKEGIDKQTKEKTCSKSVQNFTSNSLQSGITKPVPDSESGPQNPATRMDIRSVITTKLCQSKSVENTPGKACGKSNSSAANAEASPKIMYLPTDVDSFSTPDLNMTPSPVGENHGKSEEINSPPNSKQTERQTRSSHDKCPLQVPKTIQPTPKETGKNSSSLSKSFQSKDKMSFLEMILDSEFTMDKTQQPSTSHPAEVSGNTSRSSMSKENVLADSVGQTLPLDCPSTHPEAVQPLDREAEQMDHATEIFHLLLHNEIQFAVEIEMQNALNEKMNTIYGRRNQDNNTIVSCSRSKYSNILKHIVDKTFDKPVGGNLQKNSSRRGDGKESRKGEMSEKRVVTPLRIRKAQPNDHSPKSIKWTVEKMPKGPDGKKFTKKHKKNLSLKGKSNVKAGCSKKGKKGGSQSRTKVCDQSEISSHTRHRKPGTIKIDSSERSSSDLDSVDFKRDNCSPPVGRTRGSSKMLDNKSVGKGTNSLGPHSKRTHDVQKWQNNYGSSSRRSQIKDAKPCRRGQKTNDSRCSWSKKEQKVVDTHSSSSKPESLKPKIGYQGYNDSASTRLQSDSAHNMLTSSFKNYRQADDTQLNEQASCLQSNHVNNKGTTETTRGQKASIIQPGHDFSKYFTSDSKSISQTCSSDGSLVGGDRRKVFSEEMLNEMVSTNPFSQSVESLKSLNNCCVIKQLACDTGQVTRQSNTGQITGQIPRDTGQVTGQIPRDTESVTGQLLRDTGQITGQIPHDTGQITGQVPHDTGQVIGQIPCETEQTTAQIVCDTGQATAQIPCETEQTTAQIAHDTGQATAQIARDTRQVTGQIPCDTGQVTGHVPCETEQVTEHIARDTGQTTAQIARDTGQTTAQIACDTGQTTAQIARDTGQTTAQIACDTQQVTRHRPYDPICDTKQLKITVQLPLENEQVADRSEYESDQVASQINCEREQVTAQLTGDSEQVTAQLTCDSEQVVTGVKSERERVGKRSSTKSEQQNRRYPGEIDIVCQLLSTAIPDKKKNASPPCSRSGTRQSAPHTITSQMAAPAEASTPPNVTMNARVRCGIGLPPARYPPPVVDNRAAMAHHMGGNTCYAMTVQSASNIFFSSPQGLGGHFMNTGAPGGFCGPRLQGPFGRDMHSAPISFPPPMPFGDSAQCFLEPPVFGGWYLSSGYPPPNRLHRSPDDGTGFTSYRPFGGYQNSQQFRKTFNDTGPYLFPLPHKQNPLLSVVSEYSIPIVNAVPKTDDPRTQQKDSYTANAHQFTGEQNHAQTVRRKMFGDSSRRVHNRGLNQSNNIVNSSTCKSKRASRTDTDMLGCPSDCQNRTHFTNDASGLKTINSKKSVTFTQACKACGRGSFIHNRRECQGARTCEVSKNKSNAGQIHRVSSEKAASACKTVPNACGKADANNNSISEDPSDTESHQRVDNISSRSCLGNEAEDAESVYPIHGSPMKNKPIETNILERETHQIDDSRTKATVGKLPCMCRATVSCEPGQEEPLKQQLKMKFFLSSKHCPVHSDDKPRPCQQEMINQGESPPLPRQQQQQQHVTVNCLGEGGKTLTKRRFRSVKDRILESVKHLQGMDSVDHSSGPLMDVAQVFGSRVQLCSRDSSKDGHLSADSCSSGNPEPVSSIAAVKLEKTKQRKRSKRPAKSRRNQAECQRKMLQGAECLALVAESRRDEQDIFLEMIAGTRPCNGQGHIDEHDLRIGDADVGTQPSNSLGQADENEHGVGDSDERKSIGTGITSEECRMEAKERTEDPKTNNRETTGIGGACTNERVTSAKTELSGRRHDSETDDCVLLKTVTTAGSGGCTDSDVRGSERTDVGSISQIRYRPIASENECDLSVRGLALYKEFVFPYIVENGFKYITLKDALKLFELCCPECSISRSLLRKDPGLGRTLCNWDQVCLFDAIGMNTEQPMSTGDLLLRFDRLIQELPRLEKVARDRHRGTKLKKSQNCRYS